MFIYRQDIRCALLNDDLNLLNEQVRVRCPIGAEMLEEGGHPGVVRACCCGEQALVPQAAGELQVYDIFKFRASSPQA
jgi:hypothetical protein